MHAVLTATLTTAKTKALLVRRPQYFIGKYVYSVHMYDGVADDRRKRYEIVLRAKYYSGDWTMTTQEISSSRFDFWLTVTRPGTIMS
jgi:hypothetical protein